MVFVALMSCAIPALAQRASPAGLEEEERSFGISIDMPVAVIVSDRKIEPVLPIPVWRSFVELDEVRLNLHCTNESDTDMWVSRAELRKAIQFRVAREGTSISVDTRWLDEMLGVDRLPVPVPPNETFLLGRRSSLMWTVALRQTDGKPFGPGDHRVTIQLRNVRSDSVVCRHQGSLGVFVFGTGARATSGSSERWLELGRLLPTDIRYPRPPGHRLRRRLLVDAAAASRPPDEDRLAIFSAFIQLQKCDQFSHFERGRALQST